MSARHPPWEALVPPSRFGRPERTTVRAEGYRVLFSTSGGAANDAVLKLARQYRAARGAPERRIVVGLRGSYHGLTNGGRGLSGEELGQGYYGVDRRLVRHVDPDDPAELAQLLSREGHRVAALVVEPVLGSGAYPLSTGRLAAAQQLRREHGFLLGADEVATGLGRTGARIARRVQGPRGGRRHAGAWRATGWHTPDLRGDPGHDPGDGAARHPTDCDARIRVTVPDDLAFAGV